jgi:YaiO family outer membrane protein
VALLTAQSSAFAQSTYEQDIRAMTQAIQRHDDASANRQIAAARERYLGNPEVEAIALRFECSKGAFGHYSNVKHQARPSPETSELAQALAACHVAYDMADARNRLEHGDKAGAIRVAQPLYLHGSDPYGAGLLLAQAYLRNDQPQEAHRIYAELAARYPKSQELAAQARTLAAGEQLNDAQRQLDDGDAIAAIRITQPLYASGIEPYRAGLLLANAYRRNHQPADAQKIYTELSARYPNDAELSAQVHATEIDQQLSAAESELDNGHADAAIRLASPLYASNADPYRAGLLLAQARLRDGDTDDAQKIYADLAQRYPNDPELGTRARTLQSESQLRKARRQLDDGNGANAIRIAAPLYASGPDYYGAGLVLAQAYMRDQQTEQAQKVYAELARRYPQDEELKVLSVTSLVQASQSDAARQVFDALPPEQQLAVMNALGPRIRTLYPNSVTIGGTRASSSHSMPGDDDANMQLALAAGGGTIVANINHAHRFGEAATAFGIGYVRSIDAGYSGEIDVAHSPSDTFLPRYSFTLGLTKDFTTFSADVGLRHLVFVNTVVNVVSAGVTPQITPQLQMRTGALYVPETNAYSVVLEPVWTHSNGDRTFAYLTGGKAGEEISVSQGILKSTTYSLLLGHTFNLTRTVSLTGDAFYEHRAGLYNRWGCDMSIVQRW